MSILRALYDADAKDDQARFDLAYALGQASEPLTSLGELQAAERDLQESCVQGCGIFRRRDRGACLRVYSPSDGGRISLLRAPSESVRSFHRCGPGGSGRTPCHSDFAFVSENGSRAWR